MVKFMGVVAGSVLTLGLLAGCGGDDKKKEATDDSQFVVMPFVLGDTAKIDGATAENFTITVDASAAGGSSGGSGGSYMLTNPPSEAQDALTMDRGFLDHEKRSLLNRFDPSLGLNQGEWFWRAARRADAYLQMSAGKGPMELFAATGTNVGPIETAFREAATQKRVKALPLAPLAMTNMADPACPADGATIKAPDTDTPANAADLKIPVGGAFDGGDFCVVYISPAVTGGTAAEIQATVKEVVRRYKEVIYKDPMPASGGYSFKPIVAVVDFSDGGKWPDTDAYQLSGAFLAGMSDAAKQPMLYMAADFSKVKGGDASDPALAKRQWHGTVAHEMQHAIINYYRKHASAGVLEVASVDEGLAHYMEDLFGYGGENFGSYSKAFLQVWANGAPFLHSTEDGKTVRGGAQTFLYYLISQKGGVTFTDGIPSGGTGLDFIAAIVKNSAAKGPANLSATFGGTWTDVVKGYLGALVLDGTKVEDIPLVNKAQDPQANIKNLTGDSDKTYGMHFNGFGGLPEAHTWTATVQNTPKIEDISYYSTNPLLYTGAKVGSLKFTPSTDAANAGFGQAQIK